MIKRIYTRSLKFCIITEVIIGCECCFGTMLEFRVLVITLLAAATHAGVVPSYQAKPLTTIAKITSPLPYAAPRLRYVAPSTYPSPVSYAPQAPVLAIPYAKKVVATVDTDFDPHPSYKYAYAIQDVLTGDSKNQEESRDGDVVKGSYSLVEPDGTRRTVEYTADPVNGFNAIVHREPVVQKATAVPPAYTKIFSPEVVHHSTLPQSYASPIVAHYSPVGYH